MGRLCHIASSIQMWTHCQSSVTIVDLVWADRKTETTFADMDVMTPGHSSSSSDDSEEGGNYNFSRSFSDGFPVRSEPRVTSRLSLFAGSDNSDSDVSAPRPKPIVSRKTVHIKSSPSTKPSGDDDKPYLLRPKRNSPSSGSENSNSQERKKKSGKGGMSGEVEAIEKMTPASRDDDPKKVVVGKWAEENEIGLLRGLVAYIRQKGFTNGMRVFLRSISASLHMDVEESELLDKIKNLRKRRM